MMKGCMGKLLFVDLSTGAFTDRPVDEETYRRYLGGVGLAARLLYDEIPSGADPLGPDNVLGFMGGLLTGTGAVMCGRWMAVETALGWPSTRAHNPGRGERRNRDPDLLRPQVATRDRMFLHRLR